MFELTKTRMDGGKEKKIDLGAPDVSKSHRSNQQQKLTLTLTTKLCRCWKRLSQEYKQHTKQDTEKIENMPLKEKKV